MAFKNLGTVAGIYYGTTEPNNQKILWYDENTDVIRYYNTLSSSWDAFSLSAGQIKLNATDPLGYLEDKLHTSLEITAGELKIEATLLTQMTNALDSTLNLSDVASVATSRTNLSVYSQAEVDAFIGNRSYTQENLVVNGQNLTASIDALDQGFASINNMEDVTLAAPATGDILRYNGSVWANVDPWQQQTFASYVPVVTLNQLRIEESRGNFQIVEVGTTAEDDIRYITQSSGGAFPAGTILHLKVHMDFAAPGPSTISFNYGGANSIRDPFDKDQAIAVLPLHPSGNDIIMMILCMGTDGIWTSTVPSYTEYFSLGTRFYTEENVVTNAESVSESVDALDIAVGDLTYTSNSIVTGGGNLTEAVSEIDSAFGEMTSAVFSGNLTDENGVPYTGVTGNIHWSIIGGFLHVAFGVTATCPNSTSTGIAIDLHTEIGGGYTVKSTNMGFHATVVNRSAAPFEFIPTINYTLITASPFTHGLLFEFIDAAFTRPTIGQSVQIKGFGVIPINV